MRVLEFHVSVFHGPQSFFVLEVTEYVKRRLYSIANKPLPPALDRRSNFIELQYTSHFLHVDRHPPVYVVLSYGHLHLWQCARGLSDYSA